MSEQSCYLCETGEDTVHKWGKVYPRELIEIRGEIAWRHPLHQDQMFTLRCQNQTPIIPGDKIKRD